MIFGKQLQILAFLRPLVASLLLMVLAVGFVGTVSSVFTPVYAQSLQASSLDLPDTDLSNELFFNFILCGTGGPGSTCSSWFSATTPLTIALGAFNDAILFLGGLLILYTILASIMDTAHQGSFLGRRWNNGYLPIRVGIGSAMLLPIVNGICGMQIVIIKIAMLGAAMANFTWQQTVPALITTPVVSFQAQNVAEEAVINIVKGFICQDILNASGNYTSSDGSTNPQAQIITNGSTPEQFNEHFVDYSGPPQTDFGWSFGINSNPTLFSSASPQCGRVTISVMTDVPTGNSSAAFSDSSLNSGLNSSIHSMQQTQSAALQSIGAQAKAVADAFVNANNNLTDGGASLLAVENSYTTTIQATTTSSITSAMGAASPAIAATMTKGGWFLAGTWYMKIAQIQNTLTYAADQQPLASPIKAGGWFNSASALKTALTQFDTQIAAAGLLPSAGMSNFQTTPIGDPSDANSSGGFVNGVLNVIKGADPWNLVHDQIQAEMKRDLATFIGMISGTNSGNSLPDPLLQAQSLGSYVLSAAEIILTVSVVSELVGSGVGVVFATEIVSLYGLGATLQLFLPLTPYLLWTGGLIGWMTLVVESLIGASLWAVAHVHPDADGIVGRAGQGYGLVVDLFLKPTLMILGLIFALFLIKPFGYLINLTFVPAFQMALSNTDVGIVMFIAVVAAYSALIITTTKKTFDLIWFIPDNVLRWFAGLNTTQLGRTGQEFGGVADQANAATRGVVGGGVSGVSSYARTQGAERRQKRGQQEAKEDEVRKNAAAAEETGRELERTTGDFNNVAGLQSAEPGVKEGAQKRKNIAQLKHADALRKVAQDVSDSGQKESLLSQARGLEFEAATSEARLRQPKKGDE